MYEQKFDNFVVDENRIEAYHLAKEIAYSSNEGVYLVHGPEAVGKSFLLKSIMNVRGEASVYKETFNVFIKKLKEDSLKRTNASIIIVDNISELADCDELIRRIFIKEMKQLINTQKTVVFAGVFMPEALLSFRVTQNVWLSYPTVCSKAQIIEKVSEEFDFILSREVIEYIAVSVDNLRELEASVYRLKVYSEHFLNEDITLELAKKYLKFN